LPPYTLCTLLIVLVVVDDDDDDDDDDNTNNNNNNSNNNIFLYQHLSIGLPLQRGNAVSFLNTINTE